MKTNKELKKEQIRKDFGELQVIKFNEIIEAHHDKKMTITEYRLIFTALAKLTPDMKVLDTISFTVEEFCSIFDIKKNCAYGRINKVSDDILSRVIHIERKKNNGKRNWIKFQWLTYMELKDGNIYIEFNEKLKPYLLNQQENRGYTKYLFTNLFNIKSKYSIRLYELLKQYHIIGNRTILFEKLIKLIGYSGKNCVYKYFKRDTLLPILKEINNNTDLEIIFEEIKEDHKVIKLKFIFSTEDNSLIEFKKLPKTKLADYIISQYRQKTGLKFGKTHLLLIHRIILLDVIYRLDNGNFKNIVEPKNFMHWLINNTKEKYNLELLEDCKDF